MSRNEKSLKCKGPGKIKATTRTVVLTKVLYLLQNGKLTLDPFLLVKSWLYIRQMKLE